MSQKKKISKADISAAINAVDVLISDFEKGINDDIALVISATMLNTPKAMLPFDMIANGYVMAGVPDSDICAFCSKWYSLAKMLRREDGCLDLLASLFMLCFWLKKSKCCVVQGGVILGVYCSFRVAFQKVLFSANAHFHGIKTADEIARVAEVQAEIANRSAETASALASGGKSREYYKRLQADWIVDKVRNDGWSVKCGVQHVYTHEITIKGEVVPLGCGICEEEAKLKLGFYPDILKRVKKLGIMKMRKNKPGAGGDRRSAKFKRSKR